VSGVTIRFPDSTATRVGTAVVPWVGGKTLKLYLHDPVLKAEGLIGLSFHCYIYRENGERIRLQYVPNSGETLTFVLATRAMS